MPAEGAGLYVWVQSDGLWPPRVMCVVEGTDRYDAIGRVEDFAEEVLHFDPNNIDGGDVYELLTEWPEGVWKT